MNYSDNPDFEENIHGELMGVPSRNREFLPPLKGSRAEMKRHFKELPTHILQQLRAAKLRFGDKIIYSIRGIGGSRVVKFFETQDQKQIGLRSLSAAKLPKNQAMLVSGIFLLAGVAPAANPGNPTEDEIKATQFRALPTNTGFAPILNGEFTLKANDVRLVPEISMRVFANEFAFQWPVGYYKLDNPRLIQDEHEITATVETGTVQGIPTDTFLYLGLHGTMTTS